MKYIATAAVLFTCLFLCGCGDKEESSSATDTTATVTTTANTTISEEQRTAPKTESTKSTAATKADNTVSQSGLKKMSEPDDGADIGIGEAPSSGTVKATTDAHSQQTSTVTQTSGTDSASGNENFLTDDGLNWSPLVPIN